MIRPKLLAFAGRTLGAAEPARDAVQDTWESALRGLARLDDPDLAGGRARLPPDVSLLDLLDLDPPHPDRVADRWDTDGPAADLVVPLGVGSVAHQILAVG